MSRLVFDGSSTDALLSGTGSTASGTVGQAATACRNNEANCRVSGTWTVTTPTPVPEPMPITLFGAGLVGLAMVRRRKAWRGSARQRHLPRALLLAARGCVLSYIMAAHEPPS